jgi:hypothetical protein
LLANRQGAGNAAQTIALRGDVTIAQPYGDVEIRAAPA